MTPDNDSLGTTEIDGIAVGRRSQAECQGPAARGNLLRASHVEQDMPDSALAVTVRWVRDFLARPHPHVGRAGPVCPFTPTALALDTIWLTEVSETKVDRAAVEALIADYRDLFLELDPRSGQAALSKTILVVFPNLGEQGARVVDEVQAAQKAPFVEAGLMLGEFHAANESPGLRNPDFRPLRSPVPMLAIRHMVETDLPFLRRDIDAPEVRTKFLRAYLRRLGSSVRRSNFDQAIAALVDAELQVARIRAERHAGDVA